MKAVRPLLARRPLATLLAALAALAFLAPATPLLASATAPDARLAGWQRVPLPERLVAVSPRIGAHAERVSAFVLDTARLEEQLRRAPLETAGFDTEELPVISLPRPDGTLAQHRVAESPTMAPALQRRFPEIRSYVLLGDDGSIGRATWTPAGFDALIVANGQVLRVAPVRAAASLAFTSTSAAPAGSATPHLAYVEADLLDTSGMVCMVGGEAVGIGTPPFAGTPGMPAPMLASGASLRTYRLAVATTGEFYAARGGTDASVLAAIVTDIDRVNLLYGMELAIRFSIVPETTQLFYTNAGTDPYTNGTPCTMRGEAASDIPAVIGAAAFDIGHVFGAATSGGCAGGSNVCTAQKANGASNLRTDVAHPAGHEDFGGYRLIMHEIGHQFGAGHTWNASNVGNCTPAQYSPGSAVEPDSGTTIMSYLGTCGASNIAGGPADPYFHVFSHDQIVTFSTVGSGNTCPVIAPSGNAVPVVNAGPDYTIPRGTPFTLTGSASDADGDALTYTWEQVDLAAGALPPAFDDGTSPLFRSFPASAGGNVRTFPQWSDILGGTTSLGESLPTTDRAMTFALTARDGRPVGGVDSDTMTVTTSGNAFRVIEPGAGDVLQAGCVATVDWIVGSAASHADEVRILFSEDGGQTFDTLLAQVDIDANPVEVTLPCVGTTQGRIKVEAVGNIFFNVSFGSFEVVAAPAAIDLSATGGPTDGSCSRLVEFSATLTDDCGLSPADVAVTAQLEGGTAVLGSPAFVALPMGSTAVSITGTVLVSQLGDCPAEIEIEVFALDGCGFASAATRTAFVTDETPPQLVGPADQVAECDAVPPQAVVGVTDACDDAPGIVSAEEIVPGACPGQYTIVRTWTATDRCGNSAEAQQIVHVVDTTPPVITPSGADVACLWPPNHRMRCFTQADFAPTISDSCSEPVTWRFVGCASDQLDDGAGDGATQADCVIADDGLSFCVRAERAGLLVEGRRYAVTIEAEDACGNVSAPALIGRVHVPHSARPGTGCPAP